jgi:uncharacterized hydrophobic protein (TIGR00271 family)
MATTFISLRSHIENLLRIDPDSKPGVYMQVYDASEAWNLSFGLELLFSAGLATFGLVLNSPAVVIGAMLISPLMGPILGAGLALAASDLYLGIKSLLSLVASIVGAVAASSLLVWSLPFHSSTAEILARTNPNLLDLGVALVSGLAGSVVICRGGGGGGVTALPGVAIAVALMPPLCTVGFGVGSGFVWPIIAGAGLLFVTNLAAIVASAFVVFFIVRMDSLDVRSRIDYSILERISKDRLYGMLQRTWLSGGFGNIGQLRWRILMLLVVLGVLYVPLQRSLLQLRDEASARNAAREAVRDLIPADAIVTQQVDSTSNRIAIRLIVTEPVAAGKIEEAERLLLRRTGRDATVSVRRVASEEELASLRDRLMARPVPPPIQDVNVVRAEMVARLEGPLRQIWPAEAAPLSGFELSFTPEEVLVRVRYLSNHSLDEVAQQTLSRFLQAQLRAEPFRLVLEQEVPLPQPPVPRGR